MRNKIKEQDLVEIAVIGGTGVYDPKLLEDAKQIKLYTPYGVTSSLITIGTYAGRRVAFLPRHDASHIHPPHKIPYRANIYALKELGVKRIIAPGAVGGLQDETRPGDIVVVDQFFDSTKGRDYTFYDGGKICHISVAEPFCSELRSMAIATLKDMQVRFHEKGTSVCIEGPRFSTKAESFFFRDVLKAHVIGMTLVPECVLAREAEICYLSLAAVTDYDCWSNEHVDSASVKKAMEQNLVTIREFLKRFIPEIPTARVKCECPTALENAVM